MLMDVAAEKERQLIKNGINDSRLNIIDHRINSFGDRVTNVEKRVYK
jgi:hypothetical protein